MANKQGVADSAPSKQLAKSKQARRVKAWPLKGGSSLARHAGRNAWPVRIDGLAVVGTGEGARFRRKCC